MRRPSLESTLAAAGVVAAIAVLLGRLVRDVTGKPIFVDEVVSGLTAALPLGELLQTVVVDRGGAPAHFVLVHLVFLFEASADSLRWTSVACAAATVLVTYDLGRRVHGPLAGVVGAVVAATSPLLGVYGTFGRMYALFALVAALAADLLVRALDERTTGSAVAAAIAVALLPLVHPYGLAPALVIAVAAVLRLRRGGLVLPIALGALAAVPIVIAGLRLSDRFGVGRRNEARLLSPSEAADYVARSVGDLAGGDGIDVALAVALALAGVSALARTRRTFLIVAAAAVLLPLVLLVLVPTGRPQGLAHLSSRHMIFALPIWATLVGAGSATLLRRVPRAFAPAGVAAVAAVFVLGVSNGSGDPRTSSGIARVTGNRDALAAPAAWLAQETEPGDLIFYGSPVYLEALPATRDARLLDPAPGGVIGRTLERVEFPVPGVVVTVPYGRAAIDVGALRLLPPRVDAHVSSGWVVVRARGPFTDARSALEAMHAAFVASGNVARAPSRRLRAYLNANGAALCGAVRSHGGDC